MKKWFAPTLVLLLVVMSVLGTGGNSAAAPHSQNGLVINEVFAPSNSNYGNQYFELYNNSTVAIDLSSYVIFNSGGSNNLNVLPSTVIGAGQFLTVPASQLGGRIGSGLNPAGDFLALVQRGAQDNTIDVVNWGTVDPNWPNYFRFQQAFWINNAPTMPTDGLNSLQRYPNGYDTDQPTDFRSLPKSPSNPPPTLTPTASPTGSPTLTGTATPTPGAATATVTPTPYCRDAYEPDNTPALARPLQLGSEQANHVICPAGDEDWFTVDVTANKVYSFYTKDLSGGLDTIIALYTYPYDGTKIAENDDQSGCLCSRIDFSFPTSGTYLLRVRDNRRLGGAGWSYTVGFTANPGPAPSVTQTPSETPNPLAPTATPTSAPCGDPYEPDGVPEAAHLFLIGEVQHGHTFCPAGDADWFKFFGGRGKAYTIATSNLGIGVDTYMYLFDSDGKTILAENDDAPGQPPSGNPNDAVASSIQFFPIRDDFYYIMVKNKGDLGSPSMSYDIGMRVQANVPFPIGSPSPIIAPVVTVTLGPTAPAATVPPVVTVPPQPTAPLPTDTPRTAPSPTAPAAEATNTPSLPHPQPSVPATVPAGPPTTAPPPVASPTPVAPPATVAPTVGPPPTPTPAPAPTSLPTVGPIVPLPQTGHAPDPPAMISMPLAVYVDRAGNARYDKAEGIYGLRLLFRDAGGTNFATVTTGPGGTGQLLLPPNSVATLSIPYLHWDGKITANASGLLVRLPRVALPTHIP